MSSRRARYLEEMGLGPVWRLRRAAAPADAPARADPGPDAGPYSGPDPAPEPARKTPAPAAPLPTSAEGDDRAARILRMEWPALRASVESCDACPLHRTRKHTVFGAGSEQAQWMLVGEAPGAEEDASGEPFVGQAGRLLDNMLAAIGLDRGRDVYICNVLKCRPPGNRNPEPGEIAQCSPHLLRQLALVRPKLIVAMGRFAAQTLLDTDASIARLRGKVHRYRGLPLIVTYHPAYLLRNLPDKARSWEDLCFARRTLAGL